MHYKKVHISVEELLKIGKLEFTHFTITNKILTTYRLFGTVTDTSILGILVCLTKIFNKNRLIHLQEL